MHVLLMRHAKSSWDHPGVADHDRPLNDRGERAAPLMAEHLEKMDRVPDRIVSSTAKRARQTATAVGKHFGIAPELHDDLYLASCDTWQKILSVQPRTRCLLLVGHNFGIEEFVEQITGEFYRMPTAAIASFHVTCEDGALKPSILELEDVWRPKEIG